MICLQIPQTGRVDSLSDSVHNQQSPPGHNVSMKVPNKVMIDANFRIGEGLWVRAGHSNSITTIMTHPCSLFGLF